MDRDVLAMAALFLAARIALMPPEQSEVLARGVLLGCARACRWLALGAGTAGLKLEAAYQQRVSV